MRSLSQAGLHSKFQNSMGCRKILSLGVRGSMRGAGEKGKEKGKKSALKGSSYWAEIGG